MTKSKLPLIIITIGLIFAIGIILVGNFKKENITKIDDQRTEQVSNIEIKDGIQYVTINAKGGYLPRISTAKAGIPTKLIVKTNNTYDCSASLVMRSIDYQKILQKTGEEVVDLGTPEVGPFQGTCGMGMYNFQVNFE
ncbi:MAG: cupredoxin domain-containing protein [Candidatus Paceibacterota bacterium]|jgi:plastocyanin domain-containing protein